LGDRKNFNQEVSGRGKSKSPISKEAMVALRRPFTLERRGTKEERGGEKRKFRGGESELGKDEFCRSRKEVNSGKEGNGDRLG